MVQLDALIVDELGFAMGSAVTVETDRPVAGVDLGIEQVAGADDAPIPAHPTGEDQADLVAQRQIAGHIQATGDQSRGLQHHGGVFGDRGVAVEHVLHRPLQHGRRIMEAASVRRRKLRHRLVQPPGLVGRAGQGGDPFALSANVQRDQPQAAGVIGALDPEVEIQTRRRMFRIHDVGQREGRAVGVADADTGSAQGGAHALRGRRWKAQRRHWSFRRGHGGEPGEMACAQAEQADRCAADRRAHDLRTGCTAHRLHFGSSGEQGAVSPA